MTSKRRYKYLRALRGILVASLMAASFYVGRWTMSWQLGDLFATVLYVLVVLVYFRDAFHISTPPLEPEDAEFDAIDKAYGYRSYTCPKCGRLSHIPAEVEPYCIGCLAELSERG